MPETPTVDSLLQALKDVALGGPPQGARLGRLKDALEITEAALRSLPADKRFPTRSRLAMLCADEAERLSARGHYRAAEFMAQAAQRLR